MDRQFLESLSPEMLKEVRKAVHATHTVRLMERYGKPILGVNLLPDESARTIMDVEGSTCKGVSFLTPERAVKALARMHVYRQLARAKDLETVISIKTGLTPGFRKEGD